MTFQNNKYRLNETLINCIHTNNTFHKKANYILKAEFTPELLVDDIFFLFYCH